MSSLDSFNDLHLLSGVSRRDFLKLMGASAALAALPGCRNKLPLEQIFSTEGLSADTLSASSFYATTFPVPGFIQGLLVESHEGHPTKIEGNPDHPLSMGATGLFAQASILDLYSPFRLKAPRSPDGQSTTFAAFRAALQDRSQRQSNQLTAIVTEKVVSPTLDAQIRRFLMNTKHAHHYTFEPVSLNPPPPIDFEQLRCLVTVDWDFLGIESGGVRFPHEFISARRKNEGQLRLYAIESGVSLTGSKADHRWALSSGEIYAFILALEHEVSSSSTSSTDPRVRAVAADLLKNRGASMVVAGSFQPPEVAAAVARINRHLGPHNSEGLEPIEHGFAPGASLAELCHEISNGHIDTVIFLGGDPLQNAPQELSLPTLIKSVRLSAHLTSNSNATSRVVQWALPESHFLESWSDILAPDGTESLVQPLLSPLHSSVTAHELLGWLSGLNDTAYDLVRAYWKTRIGTSDFDRHWKTALRDGLWPSKDRSSRSHHTPHAQTPAAIAPSLTPPPANIKAALEIIFRPDSKIWDGRFSENPWLQELPDPTTQLCWDNAVLVSPRMAAEKNVISGDIVRLATVNGEIDAAVWVQAGLPDRTLCLTLGFGQVMKGPVSEGAGFNANALRSAKDLWRADVTTFEKTNRRYDFACTQTHHDMGARDLVISTPVSTPASPAPHEISEATDIGRGKPSPNLPLALFDQNEQWAMTIDTDSCIGCSVCVIACQAENNTPVVGKKMVMMGREMHWIRIDRYTPQAPTKDASDAISQPLPVTCMHCETAPCEVVCPVQATNHSTTGLNQMVYNRCVGTRYCSNNCPYKVRRFNFYNFAGGEMNAVEQRNPDVTVRSRGVMEKCTYCVQRIEEKRIMARKENREIRDGEIRTACQQACPTQAIVFGNLQDPKSRVNKQRLSRRSYGLLTELGTRPRTTYLSRISNFNPDAGT